MIVGPIFLSVPSQSPQSLLSLLCLYTVTVELTGFKKAELKGVKLNVTKLDVGVVKMEVRAFLFQPI